MFPTSMLPRYFLYFLFLLFSSYVYCQLSKVKELFAVDKIVRSLFRCFRCDNQLPPHSFVVAFLVVILLVIFTPSCCSYCHCSTSSNSHTVLLSKPASYSSALFSVPVKTCEHAYQSFMVVYGTEKVRQLCSYSTLAVAVKVRLRYGGSTWKVRRTYG